MASRRYRTRQACSAAWLPAPGRVCNVHVQLRNVVNPGEPLRQTGLTSRKTVIPFLYALQSIAKVGMTGLVPVEDNPTSINDLTSHIYGKLESPVAGGSFGQVYRLIIETGKGKAEVAVKVFVVDHPTAMGKIKKRMYRELKVWLRLKHPTIVPLLGIANVDSSLPALVSQWMPFGTLYVYLEETTLTASAKVGLVKGVADGLNYLQSMNVVHGDLHPGNVLIDGSRNPRLTDFGLATIEGDGELQLNSTTAERSFNSRWRAPEVIGLEYDPERPTFMSDIYSFGGVMFFTVSGDIPWKEKKSHQICIALSKNATHARPNNMLDNHWKLIQRCWSWEPGHRPRAARVLQYIDQFRTDNSQDRQPKLPSRGLADLTGQIVCTMGDLVTAGDFGIVYKCNWKRPTGSVKVAVKVIKVDVPELDLQGVRRVAENWAALTHDNIVPVLGTTGGFGLALALVLPWFQSASGLSYRSSFFHSKFAPTDMVAVSSWAGYGSWRHYEFDIKKGEYVACLTDFGLATVLSGRLGDRTIGSNVRTGAIRWIAPELLKADDQPAPTTQNDMYSFGRVMFHVLTLVIPWNGINDMVVLQRILGGEDISRPATPDVTTARWNEIAQCWSCDVSARPSATMVISFLRSELEALTDDDISVGGVGKSHSTAIFDAEQGNTSINVMPSKSKVVQSGKRQRTLTAIVNTVTLSGSQRGSRLGRTDAGQLAGNTNVPECITQSRDADSQASTSEPSPLPEIQLALAEDLTGQIFGAKNDYIASGGFADVYKCEWRRPSGPVKVAVKTFRYCGDFPLEQDLRRFRRETAIWANLDHDNIVTLYGTTEDFRPTTALVSQWFPDGTLLRLITEQGATLTIKSKLKLLHGVASGLYYLHLHSLTVVHGDITSFNVLVDLKDGDYKACLTDFGLSNVICGRFKDHPIEGSSVRPGAIRWAAPELFGPSDIKPTTQNDMYSFGRLLTLVIPWHGIKDIRVFQKILSGEDIPRPAISDATSDVTDARWNHIERCWSTDPSARPCALTAMNFITRELEDLRQDDILVDGVQESDHSAYPAEQAGISTAPPFRSSPRTLVQSRKAAHSSPLAYHHLSTVSV
ncbi:kinase-like domain-containing protein [Suillus subaureus]|uniref:Kinase-like domain-containing protein n=1 Tax=Suillus subaureus TaxID=48587 RepID=A0A9P7E771_9AGAM|nr:kinase-like domain-containing protein [Suillus subaureus]KAG1812495.1 kinase-like domain-containing protein [Suillus subaureus]